MSHPAEPGHARRTPRIEFALFAILLACYIYVLPRWADWSQNSRLDLTLAIADQGTLKIDNYYQNTGDYAFFDGHYYLDKAPGPSFLAVPPYLVMRPLLQTAPAQRLLDRLASSPAFAATLNSSGTGLLKEKLYQAAVLYLLTALLIALPAASIGVLLSRFLGALGVSQGWRLATVLLYGLGTSALPYSSAFFSHQIVAFLLLSAFYIGYRVRVRSLSPGWATLAGLMLGYALICEYPAALIAGAVGLYILGVLPGWRWRLAFLASGVPPLLLLMAYNLAIFHTPLPVGYRYSALYQDVHSVGLFSLTYPQPAALWGITFGPMRGLFYVSPVLLLAAAGLVAWRRQRIWQPELAVCAWATVSFVLFNGSSAMWQGGYAVGPRYLVPMLPFLAIGLGALAIRWGHLLSTRVLVGSTGAWSLAVIWAETLGGQNYPDWSPVPLLQYTLPRLASGDIARNLGMVLGLKGWFSLLPLGLYLLAMGAFIWRQLNPDARRLNPAVLLQNRVLMFAGLGLAALLVRLPFRSQYLFHWDSVNFALSLEHYNVLAHQPQPPGYVLYSLLGAVVNLFFHDANTSLVWISLLAGALGTIALAWLGTVMFGRPVGLLAGLLAWANPLHWFYSEVALTYTLEFLLVTLLAGLIYLQLTGRPQWWPWTAVLLGIAGGIRQNDLIFLLPLWLLGFTVLRPRQRVQSLVLLGAVILAWAAPMVALSGGPVGYLRVFIDETHRLSDDGSLLSWIEFRNNIGRLVIYNLYGMLLGLLPLTYGLWWCKKEARRVATDRRTWILALWSVPAILFYAVVHIRQPGHIFTFLPALTLLIAWATVKLARQLTQAPADSGRLTTRLVPLAGVLVLTGGLFFLVAPASLFGSRQVALQSPSRQTIARRDASLSSRIAAVRQNFDPRTTVVLAGSVDFRHPDFYLRDYQNTDLSHELKGDTVILRDEIQTVVLFDDAVLAQVCTTVPCQRVSASDGTSLRYFTWDNSRQQLSLSLSRVEIMPRTVAITGTH